MYAPENSQRDEIHKIQLIVLTLGFARIRWIPQIKENIPPEIKNEPCINSVTFIQIF